MSFKQYFIFNKEQKIGITILVVLIISVQLLYFFVDFSTAKTSTKEEEQWLAMQTEIDSLKPVSNNDTYKMYPFNPNFITDFKGYKLGMKAAEIDRLLAFRKTNKYVNSAQEFQKVTQISDSLLAIIAPYFKFPDWVTNKKTIQLMQNRISKILVKKRKLQLLTSTKLQKTI
ncbi:acyl-CoA dehydrogenase [Flavobacterium psychrophilum]|nr:acyl-CoA dehydrogenase [Flavobacterium psychrophilum]